MEITIEYLKSKGFNCDDVRRQYKDDFELILNRYGEKFYQFKEAKRITDLEVKNISELENLYYSEVGERL